jgi:hypothetical protein
MPFVGTLIFDPEPDRECWHEAGHAVIAHHFGMTVLAIGFSWVSGKDDEPYPSSWILNAGFAKDRVATELLGGVAAEIIKLGNYDVMAYRPDVLPWRTLKCTSAARHYIQQAIVILKQRDAALVRVYNRLMTERASPSYPRVQDTEDGMWKQQHLSQEDFEALM